MKASLTEKLLENKTFLLVLPIVLVLVNYFFKHYNLSYQALALDEPFSVYHAQYNPLAIIQELSKGNNPPLFELILHYWVKLFGTNESSVRFLSCLFSSVAVLFIYKIGFKFFSFKTALVASLLFTFSNYEMYFAHEARAYALFLLLTLISMYAYLSLIKEPKNKKYGILFVVSSVLLMYTHFFGGFVLFAQCFATLVIADIRKPFFKTHLKYFAWVLAFYAPYLIVFIIRLFDTVHAGTWIQPISGLGPLFHIVHELSNANDINYVFVMLILWLVAVQIVERLIPQKVTKIIVHFGIIIFFVFSILVIHAWGLNATFEYYFYTYSKYGAFTVMFLILLMACILLFVLSKKVNAIQKVVVIWFFVPLLTMYLVSYSVPMYIDRYLIFITPAFFLLLAAGMSALEKGNKLKLSVLACVIFGITCTTNVPNNRDVKGMVNKVKEIETDQTALVFASGYFSLNFMYYYDREVFTQVDSEKRMQYFEKLCANKDVFTATQFKDLDRKNGLNKYDQILFLDIDQDFVKLQNELSQALTESLIPRDTFEFVEAFKVFQFNLKTEEADSPLH